MMQEEHRYSRFGRWFEVTGWLLTAGLAALTYFGEDPYGVMQKSRLYAIAASFGLLGFFFYRLLPPESRKFINYKPQDKALVMSVTVIAFLTAFLYVRGDLNGLVFLYAVPVLLVTLLLDPNLVAAEAALSAVAIVFLQMAYAAGNGGFGPVPMARFLTFVALGVIATALTRELRRQSDKAGKLLTELSMRLDQIQTVGIIVRQVEFFPQLDTLLQRLTELVANAFDADLCAVFLVDEQAKHLSLASVCSGVRKNEREMLEVEENLKLFQEAFDSGRSMHFGPTENAERLSHMVGNRRIESIIITPLRAREKTIGVMFTANKRKGDFTSADLSFFELLGSYIAMLIDSSLLFRTMTEERKKAEQMSKLLVGRELKMRELKDKLRGGDGNV